MIIFCTFDEPSAFLDFKYQVQSYALLHRLNGERGLTVIATLHDLNIGALFFSRLITLQKERIYRDGSPSEVLTEKAIHEVYSIRVRF